MIGILIFFWSIKFWLPEAKKLLKLLLVSHLFKIYKENHREEVLGEQWGDTGVQREDTWSKRVDSRVIRGDTKSIKRRHKESISGAGLLLANEILSSRKKETYPALQDIFWHILS